MLHHCRWCGVDSEARASSFLSRTSHCPSRDESPDIQINNEARSQHPDSEAFMEPRRYGPFPYSAIIDRPALRWPNGARVAVWVIPNIEFFPLNATIPREAAIVPNLIPWTRRDYGNRVGIFRLMEALAKRNIRGTVALNSD